MMVAVADDAVDFFVSYTSADRPWAEWIAWELEQAGHSTVIQAWDMQPGSNFVLEMDEATRLAARTIAVLSPAFVESPYCRAEWAAAFARDPTGAERRLVPVRVREFAPDGLLGQVVYVDVVGLSERASRTRLLEGVTQCRAKPDNAPLFPGSSGGAAAGERVRRPPDGAAVFSVPVATATFVGRAGALERLERGLVAGGAVAVYAVHGIGGVGKTQLAAYFARAHRDDYDVVWWLRAEQPQTLRGDLATLAVALGLAAGETEQDDAIAAVFAWLERNGRWLLIADNAPGRDAVADLVARVRRGHLVITSRAPADWRALDARPLSLDVWEREESREFLMARTDERDGRALDELADALGDLPLALEQAAAYVNELALGVAGYLVRLRDRAPELFAAGRPPYYEHTIATVWQLAFDEVALRPGAALVAGVCAHVAPERIPRELLEALAHSGRPGVDARAVDDAIRLLLGYALLAAGGDRTFNMHRLIGRLTRSQPQGVGDAIATTLALLDAAWPQGAWEHECWPVCERLLAHALASTEHARVAGVASQRTGDLLVRIALYQRERGVYASARELTEHALALYASGENSDPARVSSALDVLGTILMYVGELTAARDTLERALATARDIHGSEHPEVARTLNNLGNVQGRLGELKAALVSQQSALAIKEACYGPEHPEVAVTLNNLGIVQRQLGEVEVALVTLQRALAISEAVYGPEHPEVAIRLTNLGIVQRQMGDLQAARVTLQRALVIKEAVYGSEHPEVAMTLVHLGNVLRELGDAGRAVALQERALAIETAVYGPTHHEVAATQAELARSRRILREPGPAA